MSLKLRKNRIQEAVRLLHCLGLPGAQLNERSALTLLALLNLPPDKPWADSEAGLIGVTPIMEWAWKHYRKKYAPNTRETIRRQTLHQFCSAGICMYNPDDPERPVNSPKAVYQIAPDALNLIRCFASSDWEVRLGRYQAEHETLVSRYAKERTHNLVPVRIPDGEFHLSPGAHSELIRKIVEEFAPRFAPGSELVYVGDTGNKWGYWNENPLKNIGIAVDAHGKMPDVVLLFPSKNWIILVEAVTSHGPVDGKRHEELSRLFANPSAGLVFVTAFLNRAQFAPYLNEISWETEVWVADAPSHLIHFNGVRFLGPYA